MTKKLIIETNNSLETFHINIIKEKIKKVKISIVIRVKNEEKKFDNCLKNVFSQKIKDDFEVIVIDSGSTDKTLDIAKKYDTNIYSIPSEEFNFGSSVQLGLQLSNGEYVVFISGHVIPKDNKWLENLTSNFDENTVATYGKQTYTDGTYILEKESLDKTFGDVDRVQKWNPKYKNFNDYKNEITFSNANSCIKKSIALKYKFSKLMASEDREWALRIIKDGYNIKYNSSACVYHSHNESQKQYYKRIFINSKALYEFANVYINWYHILPLYFVNIIRDLIYAFKIKEFNIKNIGFILKYRRLYVKAHFNASRKEL